MALDTVRTSTTQLDVDDDELARRRRQELDALRESRQTADAAWLEQERQKAARRDAEAREVTRKTVEKRRADEEFWAARQWEWKAQQKACQAKIDDLQRQTWAAKAGLESTDMATAVQANGELGVLTHRMEAAKAELAQIVATQPRRYA